MRTLLVIRAKVVCLGQTDQLLKRGPAGAVGIESGGATPVSPMLVVPSARIFA